LSFLECRAVSKSYDGKHALKGVTFEIKDGDLLSVVGPSGSGKTTLLRIIDGLEKADSGEVLLKGKTIFGEPFPHRKMIGMVFQNPVLFNTTVFNNIAYSLKFRGEEGETIKKRMDGMLRLLRLHDLRARNALTLSGGEAQRVALARALVYDPDLLLLDEPTANLDPYNVSIIEEVLQRSNRERGTTVIVVTHNIFQAKRLARKVAFLLEGELVEFGDSTAFFESPRDPRTLSFTRGEMVY
jgi:tungstate transport system ATP-binding protein